MIQVRHGCNSRLFDSVYAVEPLTGIAPDISIKCHRCSRAKGKTVLAMFRFKLPRKLAPIPPSSIYCADPNCIARLGDLALPYVISSVPAHLGFSCPKCKTISHIAISGFIDI